MMRFPIHPTRKFISFALLLPVLLVSSPAIAQQTRIVGPDTMRQALTARVESEQAQRTLVRSVLDRSDVRAMAAHLGLSIEAADSAVASLTGTELGAQAQHAATIEAAPLAGGANIVITTTTLLLLLILVIVLVK